MVLFILGMSPTNSLCLGYKPHKVMARSAKVITKYVIFAYVILLRWIFVETSSYFVNPPTFHYM